MASMKKESLDERLERIRKKNEELEKKHQETERDKLLAKVQGALVDCKASDDDWPKGHKYDKLDFTYDVPADKLEAEKVAKLELQQRREQQTKPVNSRGSRFTDIPQDPKSFLADEERDDKPLEKLKSDRKPQNGERREKKPSQQQSPPQGGRQIIGRHKKSPKSQNHDMSPNGIDLHNTLHQQQQQQQQHPDSNVFNSDFTNLTVSVSKDGDYKSVRLSQTPMIGSGRVGPRQITKTQFQGIEPEMEQQQQQQLPKSGFNNDMQRQGSHGNKGDRRPFNKDHQKRNGNSNNNNFRQQQQQQQQQQPQKSSPQSNMHFNLAAAPTPQQQQQQPSVKQFSVQDRLKRAQACNPVVVGNNNNSKNLVLNIIAANEVLTEERN